MYEYNIDRKASLEHSKYLLMCWGHPELYRKTKFHTPKDRFEMTGPERVLTPEEYEERQKKHDAYLKKQNHDTKRRYKENKKNKIKTKKTVEKIPLKVGKGWVA